MKAVIPVAGLGTRMLPATKAIPKEMLPLVDKPLIQYIVEEAAKAGITEIVLVTHSSKNAIENHFDTSFELESQLEQRVKRQLLDDVRSITPQGVKIIAVRQGQAKGLGHAILCAKSVVGHEPFAVLLPDVILDEYTADQTRENLAKMVARNAETKASQIMVSPVPITEVSKYGVADLGTHILEPGESATAIGFFEKPNPEEAPSDLAVVGRYVLNSSIFTYLEKTPPGAGDEVQLTDAIDMMMQDELHVEAFHMTGKSHDCGDKLGYAKAFVSYAERHKDIGEEFTKLITI